MVSGTGETPAPVRPPSPGRKWRKFRRRFRDLVLIRPGFELAAFILPRLSRRGILRLADFLAGLALRFTKRERRVALANLELIYGDSKTEAERLALARASFRTMAITTLDVFWFSRHTEARLDRYAKFDEAFDQALTHHPSLFVTAHYGNWEVMGQAVAHKGHPISSIA